MFAVRQTFRIERKQDISLKRPGGVESICQKRKSIFFAPH